MEQINVYGTEWCEDTQHTLEHLQQRSVPFQYINIEQEPQAQDWVKRQNDGVQKTPTVQMKDLVLSVPSDAQLDAALRARGVLPA